MDKQEAYSLLGVESGDKLRDVRRKYHLLMHMHHPDVLSDNGNTDTARQLNEAFEIIKRGDRGRFSVSLLSVCSKRV